MTEVEDQGQTSSCVANAVAGAYEYAVKRATQENYDVSRLFVYYNARWANKEQDEDAGSIIQYAMDGLQKFGACAETTWPFKKELLLQKPNQTSYKQGADGRVKEMRQVPVTLEAWKQCLAEGLPIVFGCVLFDSFDDCENRGGVVPMPNPQELTRKEHGGHSMCCVGYSDVEGVFIIRNSWGKDWADQGYCYMPYNYLMNPKFNDGDCWVFTPPTAYHPPTEAWSEEETPVVNGGKGVDFNINEFPIEAYTEVAVNFFESIGMHQWSAVLSEAFHEYASHVHNENFHLIEEYSVDQLVEQYSETTTTTSEESEVGEESEVTDEATEVEEDDDEESEDEDSEDEEDGDGDEEGEEDGDDEDDEDGDDEEEDGDDEDSDEEDDSDDEDEDSDDDDSEDEDGDDSEDDDDSDDEEGGDDEEE